MGRVTLDGQGRWHVSFSALQVPVERTATGVVVGLDRGVANTLTTSDGEHLGIPTPTVPECAKRGKLTGRQADCRKDWVEQTSTWLVRSYDVVVFGDLKVRNMVRSAAGLVVLARGGADVGRAREPRTPDRLRHGA